MTHILLAAVAVVLLAVSWVLYLRNKELFIIFLLVIYLEFFFLLPDTPVTGQLKLMLLPMLAMLLMERLMRRKLSLGRYGAWTLTYVLLTGVGIVVAGFYGQDLMLGVKAAKVMPLALFYFVVVGEEIDHDKFTRYFIALALVIAVLTSLQAVLDDKIAIFGSLSKHFVRDRLGRMRITYGQSVIPVAALMAYVKWLQSKGSWYGVLSILLFLQVLYVEQTRMIILGLILSAAFLVLLIRGMAIRKGLALLVGLSLLGFVMHYTPLGGRTEVGLARLTLTDLDRRTGSYRARVEAYRHYWEQTRSRPVFGRGILNNNWSGNQDDELRRKRIFLSDIGIVQFVVSSGLVGSLWFLLGFVPLWRDVFRHPEHADLSTYVVLGTLTMATIDMFLLKETVMLFFTFVGLLSNAIAQGDAAPDED